ncbi:MAG: hypothetical protein IPJ86_17035 [Bacteroidetes bacterium]|nr:hypothetical protein [Bacteroidota bacterium]
MKIRILTLIIGIAFLGFSSCKKDDSDGGSSTPGTSNLMTAKVDGVNWTSLGSLTGGSIISNVSICSGIAADSSRISFSIMQSVALNGTYDMGFGSGNVASFATTGSSVPWVSSGNATCTGTLTITALNTTSKRMSGTFSFKGYRNSDNSFKEITVGVFTNVAYSTGSTGGGGNNTFTVKINNVNWVPDLVIGDASNGDIVIDATNSAGTKSVTLQMPDTITPGSYVLDGNAGVLGYYSPSLGLMGISTSGTLNITTHNTSTNTIIGTFNYTAEEITGPTATYTISNGTFNITY